MSLKTVGWGWQGLKAPSLKQLALNVGARTGSTKAKLEEGIETQCNLLEKLRQRLLQKGKISIFSIDVGVSNFAFAQFELQQNGTLPILKRWDKLDIVQSFLPQGKQTMSLNPEETCETTTRLTEYLTSAELPDLFTIERQRARSMSSKTVLEPVLRSNVLEQILFSNLRNKCRYLGLEYLVTSSDPLRMTNYWMAYVNEHAPQMIAEHSTRTKAQTSKLIRIEATKQILAGPLSPGFHLVEIPAVWKDKLLPLHNTKSKIANILKVQGTRKDDDLADSFLHGLAWMRWLLFYKNSVTTTSGPNQKPRRPKPQH